MKFFRQAYSWKLHHLNEDETDKKKTYEKFLKYYCLYIALKNIGSAISVAEFEGSV